MTAKVAGQLPAAETLEPDRFVAYERAALGSHMVPAVLRLLDRDGLRVCDVGGGSGLFLAELLRLSPRPIRACNLEYDERNRARQASDRIAFVHASILDSGLPDDSFDVVTFRHVLHHLVAGSVAGTLANQRRALEEVFRLTRPGGHVVFQEQVNRVRAFARAIYALSRAASGLRLRCEFFQVGKVVVLFLTPREIAGMVEGCRERFGLEVLRQHYVPWRRPWRWRLTLLMGWVGHVFYVLRVHKGRPA